MTATVVPTTFRSLFPIFEHTTFVNSCSKGALGRPVEVAVQEFMASWARSGSDFEAWGVRAREARARFARLIGAAPEEVGICYSASDGIASVASALTFDERPRVVTTPFEFPTVHYVWQAQARRGAELVVIQPDGHELTLDRYADAINARTGIVTATLVCYKNGFRTSWLRELADLAHEHGAYLFVDAYQGLGAVPLDVKAEHIDFLVSGSLKYLLGLPGAGFIYVRRELIESLRPMMTSWQAQEDGFAPSLNYAVDARRFQMGSAVNISLYAAHAGMGLILDAGPAEIGRSISALATYAIHQATALGFDVITPEDPNRRGPLVAIRTANADQLVRALATERIVVSHRAGAVRVSLHHYNTREDIDRLVIGLQRHRDVVTAAR